MAHVASALLRASSGHGGGATLYAWDATGNVRATTARDVLRRALGLAEAIRKHDATCVAIHVHDGLAFVEAFYAITAAGCVAAPLHVRWSHEECADAIDVVDADVLFVERVDVAAALAKRTRTIRRIFLHDASPSDVRRVREVAPHVKVCCTCDVHEVRDDATTLAHAPCGTAFVCFTSGTSGRPKAARVSHASALYQAMQKRRTMALDVRAHVLHALPLAHVGALSQLHASMWSSCRMHVFLERFEARTCREAMKKHSITHLSLVPPMLDDFRHVDGPAMAHVRTVLVGGGPLDAARKDAACALFPNAAITTAYGATEAFSTVGVGANDGSYEAISDTWAIWCEQHGCLAITPDAWCGCEGGEVLVRGPHVMLGYRNDLDTTQNATLQTKWWKSGDMGAFLNPAGTKFRIVGRIKDVIRTGGEGVHATQVEQILEQHPTVRRAAVFGIPHAYYGEMVTAAIELQPGEKWYGTEIWHAKAKKPPSSSPSTHRRKASGEELQTFCRNKGLSGFKLPRIIWCRREGLPVNSLGKIFKSRLQEELQQVQEQNARTGDAENDEWRLFFRSKM